MERRGIKTWESGSEKESRGALLGALKSTPVPDEQLLSNLGLFLDSKSLSRVLFMDFLYRQIVDVQGVVMEFGTRWGQNLALFSSLRAIYEPYNRHRQIVGFDTFSGFPAIAPQDGKSDLMHKGHLDVGEGYDGYLAQVLAIHESINPLPHIPKFQLRKGDAVEQLPRFLQDHPQTIIALAYFDFDLYEPTRKCLEIIKPRLTRGSVLGFDELNDPDSPGETLALMEVLGLNNVRVKRFPFASRVSYLVFE